MRRRVTLLTLGLVALLGLGLASAALADDQTGVRTVSGTGDLTVSGNGTATLDFSGSATISGIADDWSCDDGAVSGACAARLGKASWDKDLNSASPAVRDARDGKWTGHFFFRLADRLPGAWEATRPWDY